MKNKKIFLHIGLPKTGTTALQVFLANHTELLAKNGIVYPLPGRKSQQHSYLAVPDREDSDLVKQAWAAIYRELESTKWQTAIFSSERFFLCDPVKIYEALSKITKTPTVVLFLRNKIPLLLSCYRTAIKSEPRVCCDADTFIPFFFNNHTQLDYHNLIKRWTSVFGDGNVHLISYEKVCETSNTIEAFLDILKQNKIRMPDFSDTELNLRSHITQPDIVFDLLLRTNQFYYGDFPYWEVILQLFDIAEKIGIDHDYTTSNMQPQSKGLAILKKDEMLWNNALEPDLPENFPRYFHEIIFAEKQEISGGKRIEMQMALLEHLPSSAKNGMQKKINLPLNKIPGIAVIKDELQHYATLYRRNYNILKEYADNEELISFFTHNRKLPENNE